MNVAEETPSEAPPSRNCGRMAADGNLSWIGKSVQTLKLLNLAAPVPGLECADRVSEPGPEVWATQNAIHEPAIPARVRSAELVLDERLLTAAFLAAKEEVVFPFAVGSYKLPSIRDTVFAGVTPPFAVIHRDE